MKKYIIPIILAILIISLSIKLSNNGTIEKFESKINEVKQDLSSKSEKIEDKIKEKIILEEKSKEDQLMINCKNSFKECRSTGIKKYGWSISLSETEKFYSKETAEEFYNTWSIVLNLFGTQELELDYPIVLFAFSIKKGDNQLPDIAICEDGELTESSKMRLGC